MKTVSLIGTNITDDKWHTVRVSRRGNTVSLQLDFKAKAYATTGMFCVYHCTIVMYICYTIVIYGDVTSMGRRFVGAAENPPL